MKKRSRFYPRVQVDTAEVPAVGQAGGVLLTETIAAAGLDVALSLGLAPWRKPLAIHDPGKVVLDLALSLALGGDCLADIALLRAEPGVYSRVASDPTVSRTIDATLVTSHSEKESAAPTFKRGFGHHPLCSFVDHGPDGSGEPLAVLLRAGNAGSNTAADHITIARAALAQLPGHRPGTRPGRKVLIRTDGAGASHAFLDWLHGQRLSYSIGFGLPDNTTDLLAELPAEAWTPAYDAHDQIRGGAWVAELTGLLDLTGWPPGMRVIARNERPHPGAQLRITDADGLRVTAFATNTTRGPLADLELRHRRRARAEDRIRCAKDTGLTNLPLHDFAQNQIWCAIVALACELTAWMQMLALTDSAARRWEPKRLRTRLFTVPATLARSGRRRLLHLAQHHPWAPTVAGAIGRLRGLLTAPIAAPS